MSSAICFNLDPSKISSSGNGLIHLHNARYNAIHYLIIGPSDPFCLTLSRTTNYRLFQTKKSLQTTISNLIKVAESSSER